MKKKLIIVPIQKKCSHIKVLNSNKNAKINNHHETDSVKSEWKTPLWAGSLTYDIVHPVKSDCPAKDSYNPVFCSESKTCNLLVDPVPNQLRSHDQLNDTQPVSALLMALR